MAELTADGLAQWLGHIRKSLDRAAEAARLALADSLARQSRDSVGPARPARPSTALIQASEPLVRTTPLFKTKPLFASAQIPEARSLLDRGQALPRRGVWRPTPGQLRAALQAAARAFERSIRQQ